MNKLKRRVGPKLKSLKIVKHRKEPLFSTLINPRTRLLLSKYLNLPQLSTKICSFQFLFLKLKLNCETDFVARNEKFLDLSSQLAKSVLQNFNPTSPKVIYYPFSIIKFTLIVNIYN